MAPSDSYGLVVEGTYDVGVYEELIRRLAGNQVRIVVRDMGGVPNLLKSFYVILRDLEHGLDDQPVQRVLVVRDADGKDPGTLEDRMHDRLRGETFSFRDGVRLHAVVQSVETWLLADAAAISSVATARGGQAATGVAEELESMANPKVVLERCLSAAGLVPTPLVYREIGQRLDLPTLRTRCPHYPMFEAKVL